MRCVQVSTLTGPDGLRLVDIAAPEAGDNTLVQVRAVGISYPDVLRSRGQYQDRKEPPYVFGNELAGEVATAPPGSRWQPGDRVFGTVDGAAAELVAASDEGLLPLPDRFTFEQGASLYLNYSTAIVALKFRGRIAAGETLLVHGAGGGTGTAALQVARALGARTIGIVSDQTKADAARRAGADHVLMLDPDWKDKALELTDGRGVDIVFDPVGGEQFLDTLRALAPRGRWVVIGFVGGTIPQIPANRVLLRNVDVVGSSLGGYLRTVPGASEHLRSELVDVLASEMIDPIVGNTLQLDDAAEAVRILEGRRAVGKVVLALP
jgi:NADPH2:quinone reductase